jgi:hypothetical protein
MKNPGPFWVEINTSGLSDRSGEAVQGVAPLLTVGFGPGTSLIDVQGSARPYCNAARLLRALTDCSGDAAFCARGTDETDVFGPKRTDLLKVVCSSPSLEQAVEQPSQFTS